MKYFFCFLFVVVFIIPIQSQNYIDLLKLNAGTTPLNKFDSTSSATVLNDVGADLTLPVKINDKNTFLTGVIYEGIETKLFPNEKNKTISSLLLKVGYNKKFNDRFSGTIVLLPKVASNFGPIGSKDFQFGAIALFKYEKNKNFNYKYGVYYNSELFGPFFVPMLGFYYLSNNKKFEANVLLPLQVDLNYKLIPLMNIGLNFNGQIRSYHLTNISKGLPSTYLTRSTNELFAYLKFNLGKSLVVQTKAGYSFARYYRVYNDNDKVTFGLPLTFIGNKRPQLNTDFSDGLLFQFILIYRLHLEPKE